MYLQQALDYAKQAVAEDTEKNYKSALNLYQRAVDYFLLALKYGNNTPESAREIKQNCNHYLDRAEILKTKLNSKEKNEESNSGGSIIKNRGESDKDNEASALQAQLASVIVKHGTGLGWDDVIGAESAKAALKEAVVLPMKFPHLFRGKRRPWRGILMFGPPGTGKSYLARAAATEADNATFFNVSSSDLISKWVGESEKLVKLLYTLARKESSAIIFIDEIDSLCSARKAEDTDSARRIKTEMLVQMEGMRDDAGHILLTLAATNTPWELDSAIRRRFEKRIYIDLPTEIARRDMFRYHLRGVNHDLTPADLVELSKCTDGYSAADLSVLLREALMQSVRKIQTSTHFKRVSGPCPTDSSRIVNDLLAPCSPADPEAIEINWRDIPGDKLQDPPLTKYDVFSALRSTKPTVSKDDIRKHQEFAEEFGQEGS